MRQYLWIAIFLIGCGSTTAPTPTEPELTAQHARLEPVQFQTPDGFLLFGTLFSSPNHPAPRPAVILLHPLNANHVQWADFVPELVAERGYLALAFDLRGHGNSIFRNGQPVTIQNFSIDEVNQMPLDVVAAIAFLKTRAEADPNRIGVIGTDIGANIAFVSAGLFPDIKATVSVSPDFRTNQALEILIGTNIPDFAPRNILYLAAFGDGYAYTSSQTMSELTRGVTAVVGYQGAGRGLDLLAQGNAWATVLDWLDQNL